MRDRLGQYRTELESVALLHTTGKPSRPWRRYSHLYHLNMGQPFIAKAWTGSGFLASRPVRRGKGAAHTSGMCQEVRTFASPQGPFRRRIAGRAGVGCWTGWAVVVPVDSAMPT